MQRNESYKADIEGIQRIDDTLTRAVKGLRVINLSSWRVLKKKRKEHRQSLAARGYK